MSLSDQLWCPASAQVTVLQARGLRIKGKGGTNDAYAVMQVGKEKYQTSVVEKSVAPVWKEEATFDLPQQQQQGGGGGTERSTLHVHVLHRALVGPDKLLGQAVINLLQLSEDKTRNKTEWFKLLDKTGKADKDRGEVLVDIQFMRNNMTASMFDLSAAGKSRSRLGKFKDKVRGKKKESDAVSTVVPSFTQVLTDSEEEGNGDAEAAAGKDEKKKKNKMKSLFSPKSNLQKNMSQSMSVLPGKNSPLSGSQSSGLNVDPSEGKKKFKFKIHKRSGSSDNKDSSSGQQKHATTEQSNLCINGSHVYCEEPPARTARIGSNFSLASSGHGSMEDVPDSSPPSVDSLRGVRQYSPWTEEEEEMAEVEDIKEDVEEERIKMEEEEEERRRQERRTIEEEEKRQREEEERIRIEEEKAQEERRRQEEERRLAEEKRRLEEEERRRNEEKVRKEEEERIQRKEEERRRREEEERARREEEERERLAEEKKRLEEVERRRFKEEEKRQREEEERIRMEEERAKEERRRQEEERELAEEKKRLEEEERRRIEEEEIRRLEEQERRRIEEEERIRIEEEMAREQRRREEEENAKRQEEERKLAEQKRRLEEEERRQREERISMEEELRRQEEEEKVKRQEEEHKLAEEKKRLEEEERSRIEEEEVRKEEEERIRREEEERRRQEEEELVRRLEEEREEKRRLEEQERKRKEEEERIKKEEEENARKEKEEYERLVEKKRKLEEEERKRIEAEEKIRKEEEERVRTEEDRRRKEEERRLEEEQEKLAEERRIIEEQERRIEEEEKKQREEEERIRKEEERRHEEEERKRIVEEERIRQEEQEKIRMEKERRSREAEEEKIKMEEEEKARQLEKVTRNAEEQKMENKTKQKVAGRTSKVGSSAEVYSTNPFDEDFSNNPFDENPNSPAAPDSIAVSTVQQRSQPAASSVGSKTSSADEKDLISSQREKRPAPQPPGRNQAEGQSQDGSTRHLVQVNKQSKDKDAKIVSVPPQRSVQMIVPLNRSPTDAKNTQSLGQSQGKRPAPSAPSEPKKALSSDGKIANKSSSEAKQEPVAYGSNPFEDDEDENELTAQDTTSSIQGPPAVSQAADGDAASQAKIKSSKKARAPLLPATTAATSSISINQNTEGGHDTGVTTHDDGLSHPCDPEEAPVQESQPAMAVAQEAGGKKEVPPVTSRRLQPVKPLNPLGQHPLSVAQGEMDNKSTGIHSEVQEKTKAKDTELKGPYSQLTREELISLVLKQDNQLSGRDKKISELELYIDNLLVRVMEESPSILMSMNSLKKTV